MTKQLNLFHNWEEYLSEKKSIEVQITKSTDLFSYKTLKNLIDSNIEKSRSAKLRFQMQSKNGTVYFQVDCPCCNCCPAQLWVEVGVSLQDRQLMVETRSSEEILEKMFVKLMEQ